MAVPENGWSSLAEATLYFNNNRLVTTHWDRLATDDLKNKVLNNSHIRITSDKRWSIPSSPNAAQLVTLKLAQQEAAYSLALHLADEDRRKGIQAQGVQQAGIVKEVYPAGTFLPDWIEKIPFPAIVLNLLDQFLTAQPFYSSEIDRDEERGVNDNVTDF